MSKPDEIAQPAPYTCKHGCERDKLMDALARERTLVQHFKEGMAAAATAHSEEVAAREKAEAERDAALRLLVIEGKRHDTARADALREAAEVAKQCDDGSSREGPMTALYITKAIIALIDKEPVSHDD